MLVTPELITIPDEAPLLKLTIFYMSSSARAYLVPAEEAASITEHAKKGLAAVRFTSMDIETREALAEMVNWSNVENFQICAFDPRRDAPKPQPLPLPKLSLPSLIGASPVKKVGRV